MKTRLVHLLSSLLLGAGAGHAQTPVGDGLRGAYYQGLDFDHPEGQRLDARLDFEWQGQPPLRGMLADYFTVRWTGWLVPPVTGRYVLRLTVDDAVRLWLDNKQLLDEWRGQPLGYYEAAVDLEAGHSYRLRLNYAQYSLSSRMQLAWERPRRPEPLRSWRNLWNVNTPAQPANRQREVVPTRYLFSHRPAPPAPPRPMGTVALAGVQVSAFTAPRPAPAVPTAPAAPPKAALVQARSPLANPSAPLARASAPLEKLLTQPARPSSKLTRLLIKPANLSSKLAKPSSKPARLSNEPEKLVIRSARLSTLSETTSNQLEKPSAPVHQLTKPAVAALVPPPLGSAPAGQPPADTLAARLHRGQAVTWRALYFEQGRATLPPPVQASLDTLARLLARYSTLRLEVQGHTDNQGDSTLNRQLSRQRAEAVCRYLTAHGVAADRLRPVGLGGTRPVADNRRPAQRPRNRRVVLRPLP